MSGKINNEERIYLKNIENVTSNQVFANYKALCEYMGQPVLSGNSKRAQVKEWKRYFDFSRDGQKIKIEKTYEILKSKVDNRKFNGKSIYSQLIENMLMYYCGSVCAESVNITLNQIILICGMANERYVYRNIYKKFEDQEFDYFNIADFIFRTKNKFNSMVNSALGSMNRKGIIGIKKILMVSTGGIHRPANEDEINYIELIEKYVLDSMGKSNISDVVLAGKYNIYCKRVKKEVLSEINIDYFYRGYFIKIKDLRSFQGYMKIDYMNMKSKLNREVIKYFNNQAKNKEFTYLKKDKKVDLPESYLFEQERLANLFLKI